MDEEESFVYAVGGGAEDEFAAMLFDSNEGRRSNRIPVTYRWRDMDPGTAEAVWKHLGQWVQWLVDTYHLPTSAIPDCWWMHSDMVAELYGLQRAEQASYTEDNGGFGPMTFHERLTSSIERMHEHARTAGCVGLQAHRVPGRRTLPPEGPGRPNWTPDSDG